METTKARHKHRAAWVEGAPFAGPVSRTGQNRMAHGNVVRIEHCECGASRRTNVNGPHREYGDWVDWRADR